MAVALFLACFVSYALFEAKSIYITDYPFIAIQKIGHYAGYIPHLFVAAAKINFPNHFNSNKSGRRQKTEYVCDTMLSVFKGREAKLNRAILLTLSKIVLWLFMISLKKLKNGEVSGLQNILMLTVE